MSTSRSYEDTVLQALIMAELPSTLWVRKMVRRYGDLIREIRDRQRFTRIDWTKKVINALLFTLEQMEDQREQTEEEDKITYEQWKDWQESLAKQFGFSETTDKPVDKTLRNLGWKKIASEKELIAH